MLDIEIDEFVQTEIDMEEFDTVLLLGGKSVKFQQHGYKNVEVVKKTIELLRSVKAADHDVGGTGLD